LEHAVNWASLKVPRESFLLYDFWVYSEFEAGHLWVRLDSTQAVSWSMQRLFGACAAGRRRILLPDFTQKVGSDIPMNIVAETTLREWMDTYSTGWRS